MDAERNKMEKGDKQEKEKEIEAKKCIKKEAGKKEKKENVNQRENEEENETEQNVTKTDTQEDKKDETGGLHDISMDGTDLETENELKNTNEPKSKYCKHHAYGRCKYRNTCWKIHDAREYKRTIRCKFFEEGRCQNGYRCEYKHLMSETCRYYEKGNCYRGDACTYRHLPQMRGETPKAKKREENDNNKVENKPEDNKITQNEQNFPEDTRKLDQITTAITKIMNSREFIKQIGNMIIEKM